MKSSSYKLLICLALCLSSICQASTLRQDYRTALQDEEVRRMHEFHLQQAETKLSNAQPAYAWGDYAYLLCQIPNHHMALAKMSELAQLLNKQQELQQFFEQAVAAFPDDQKVQELYAAFKAATSQR